MFVKQGVPDFAAGALFSHTVPPRWRTNARRDVDSLGQRSTGTSGGDGAFVRATGSVDVRERFGALLLWAWGRCRRLSVVCVTAVV